MSRILIGTSGYHYSEWVGPFYPEQTKSADYLPLYAQHYATVELNFSYYRMPEAASLALMHQSAPALRFSIKGYQSLTHRIDPALWRAEATRFSRALEPLLSAGALEAVLLQFPYSFHYEVEQRRYLAQLVQALSHLPLAVEFRNSGWYNNRTLDELRRCSIAFVCLDLPEAEGNPPMMDVVTAPLSYLRLHGRNANTWWGSDAASRYDYLYSDAELGQLIRRLLLLSAQAETTLVYFNNHRNAQATANATRLLELLQQRRERHG
ncbi:MAG: DUF72 domain-containing protein [Proteobacteria bacterium]|nr:DUF72 domain-containing protein [Pseudomonadota bacterium]